MSPAGRELAAETARAIRSSTLSHAARRGWEIVPHRFYADWVAKTVEADDRHWLVLDPLLSGHDVVRRGTRINLTRHADSAIPSRATGLRFDGLADHQSVGVIDDAVSSGRTLCQLGRVCLQQGSRIDTVAVACSSRVGRATVETRVPGVRWFSYLLGDWQALHLRDGCPFLPYSGRPFRSVAPQGDAVQLDLRLPSWLVAGSIWQVLWLNADVQQSIRDGYRRILRTLTARLERPPQIGDLSLFGDGVTCLADRDPGYVTDTALKDLLPVTLA